MQSSPRTTDISSLDLLSAPGVPEYSLMMTELDIQHIARLMREFVTMNLVPWMERCVVEWNENVRASLVFHVLSEFTHLVVVFVDSSASFPLILFYSSSLWFFCPHIVPCNKHIGVICWVSESLGLELTELNILHNWRWQPSVATTSFGGVRNHPGRLQACYKRVGSIKER